MKLVGGRAVAREHGPADASVDLDGRTLDTEWAAERMPEPAHERGRLLVVAGAEGEDHELVASDARDGVARADDRLEAAGERAQDGVAGPVTADVVHVLEAVEVDADHGERLAAPLRARQGLLDPVLEQDAVREAGERVAERKGTSASEPAVERHAARAGDAADEHEGADNERGVGAEHDRGRARDEDERREAQPRSDGSAQMPPVSDLHPVPVVVAARLALPQ